MTAADRLSPGYEPNFDIDLALGQQGELYVVDIIDSLVMANGRIEIKTDERSLDTGNLYVEYECRKFGGWQKSGIAVSAAEFWAFVIGGDTVLVAPAWRVKEAVRRLYKTGAYYRKECVRGSHPTRGVIIPLRRVFEELFGPASGGTR